MLNVNIFFFAVMNNLDCPEPWQMGFQDPATPVIEGIIDFHHDVMFFLIVIGIGVMNTLIIMLQMVNQLTLTVI